jgi:hypothetical protein
MELRGFELGNIDLELGEEVYDLHNSFDFGGFSYDVAIRELMLRWVRGKGDWVPRDSPSEIVITIRKVSHLSVTARDPEMPYSEDDCLNCVSFVRPNEATEDSFMVSSPADPNLHYVFQFMSGFTLRVQAEDALCSITQ